MYKRLWAAVTRRTLEKRFFFILSTTIWCRQYVRYSWPRVLLKFVPNDQCKWTPPIARDQSHTEFYSPSVLRYNFLNFFFSPTVVWPSKHSGWTVGYINYYTRTLVWSVVNWPWTRKWTAAKYKYLSYDETRAKDLLYAAPRFPTARLFRRVCTFFFPSSSYIPRA